MSNDNNNMNTKDFLIGTLVGGLVGAASALLLAPKSGKELREDINEQASSAKELTSGLTNVAKDLGAEYATIAKEKSSTIAKTVSEQSSTIAKTVSEQSSSLLGRVKELTESVKRDVEELNQSAEDLKENIQDSGAKIADTEKKEVTELVKPATDEEPTKG